jgi:hypothetical protein
MVAGLDTASLQFFEEDLRSTPDRLTECDVDGLRDRSIRALEELEQLSDRFSVSVPGFALQSRDVGLCCSALSCERGGTREQEQESRRARFHDAQ